MEQQSEHDDLYPLNPKKDNAPVDPPPLDLSKTKNNEDPKRKYTPLAGLKRKSSTNLETIQEDDEWYYLDQTTKTTFNLRKKGTKTWT